VTFEFLTCESLLAQSGERVTTHLNNIKPRINLTKCEKLIFRGKCRLTANFIDTNILSLYDENATIS
jgi:hypothetical protein